MKDFIASIPKMWLGPIIVIFGIIYFVLQENPVTICDVQYEIFQKEVEKFIFGYKRKNVAVSPAIKADIANCMQANSPGGCYDWMVGLKNALHSLRNMPSQCGDKLETASFGGEESMQRWMEKSVWLFSQISWNEAATVRPGLFNWLDTDDIYIYCKLKSEYLRLFKQEKWNVLQQSLLQNLVKEKKMDQKSAWGRTILSHKCN